jgi:hypothetical protein
MRRIKSLEQLRIQKERLNGEKTALMLTIKNEWEEIKKGNKPINMAGQFISGIITQSIFQNAGQAYMAEKATHVAIDFIKKSFINIRKWLGKKKK